MPRQINRLTQEQVEALKEPGWYADGGGLYLRIQRNTKSWVLVDTRGGKRKEKGIGPLHRVSLAQAREIRDRLWGPSHFAQMVRRLGLPPTFGEIATEFMDERKAIWRNPVHREQWRSTLKNHAAGLQDKLPGEIGTDDVLAVIRPLWQTTNETASRLRGRIERILDAARARGHISMPWENPARWHGHLEHLLPPHKVSKRHHAAIPWQDMPAFWTALAWRKDSSSVQALRFTILTAARTAEVIGARQNEFDLEAKIWTIPSSRMKMGLEHRVPLSDAAVAIIWALWPYHSETFIFEGAKPDHPLSTLTMLRLLQVHMGRDETVHGFRSSFRDFAGEATNYPRELAEMALAHAVGDAVEQAYRRGRAVERRRPMMEDWARYLVTGELPSLVT